MDLTVCLGDIVGYGANPNECVEILQQHKPLVLLGNHDEAALDPALAVNFNPQARAAILWTNGRLTPESKTYLSDLPYVAEFDDILFVHSSPYQPEQWHYISTQSDAVENYKYFSQPLCFIGHTHVAGLFFEDMIPDSNALHRNRKCIVNVGSVGQPRDEEWRLSFGIFDSDLWKYEPIRAEYDVRTAYRKILDAGLPRVLAERLLLGR